MAVCNLNTLMTAAKAFQGLDARGLQISKAQLLCGINGGSVLPNPPVPTQLFGGRDSATEAHAGCNDFDNDQTGIASVHVYRSSTSGSGYVMVGSFNPVLDNFLNDTGLSGSLNYYYVLRSFGDGVVYEAIESGNSAEICALVAPTDFGASVGVTSADISWQITINPTDNYEIQLDTDAEFPSPTTFFQENPASHVFGFFGLTEGTDYYVRIRARNTASCVSEWLSDSFTTDST